MKNTTENNKEIKIDLNLPLYPGTETSNLYRKEMFMVYDLADKVNDYTSIVVMDHGIVLQTIESRAKRKEDLMKAVERFKEIFSEYLKKKENETFGN